MLLTSSRNVKNVRNSAVWKRSIPQCGPNRNHGKDSTSTGPTWNQMETHGNILIIVDAGSNYIDAIPCNCRSALSMRRCLSREFALFGLPQSVVSDNAPEFIAQREWLTGMGVKQLLSPPFHPQSNGPAERAVATIKKCLQCWNPQHGDWFCFLQKKLLNHRSSTGKKDQSPGQRLMNRQLRTCCNQYRLLEPAYFKRRCDKQAREVTVVTQAGRNTAVVFDDGKSWLASFDQLARKQDTNSCEEEPDLQTPVGWRSQRTRRSPDRFIPRGQVSWSCHCDVIPYRDRYLIPSLVELWSWIVFMLIRYIYCRLSCSCRINGKLLPHGSALAQYDTGVTGFEPKQSNWSASMAHNVRSKMQVREDFRSKDSVWWFGQ